MKNPTRKRLINIAKRMILNGEYFYTIHSPKMSMKEYEELHKLGFWIQSEWPHPPESRMFYMMEEFEKKNTDLLYNLIVS